MRAKEFQKSVCEFASRSQVPSRFPRPGAVALATPDAQPADFDFCAKSKPLDALPTAPSPPASPSPTAASPTAASPADSSPTDSSPADACASKAVERPTPSPRYGTPPSPRDRTPPSPRNRTPPSPTGSAPAGASTAETPLHVLDFSGSLCSGGEIVRGESRRAFNHAEAQNCCRRQDGLWTEHVHCSRFFIAPGFFSSKANEQPARQSQGCRSLSL